MISLLLMCVATCQGSNTFTPLDPTWELNAISKTKREKLLENGDRAFADANHLLSAACYSTALSDLWLTDWHRLETADATRQLTSWSNLLSSLVSLGDSGAANYWLEQGMQSFAMAGAGGTYHHPFMLDTLSLHAAILDETGRSPAAAQVLHFRLRVYSELRKELGTSGINSAALDLARFLDRYALHAERDRLLAELSQNTDDRALSDLGWAVWSADEARSDPSFLEYIKNWPANPSADLLTLRSRSARSQSATEASLSLLRHANRVVESLSPQNRIPIRLELLTAETKVNGIDANAADLAAAICEDYFELKCPSTDDYRAMLGALSINAAHRNDLESVKFAVDQLNRLDGYGTLWRATSEKRVNAHTLITASCEATKIAIPSSMQQIVEHAARLNSDHAKWIKRIHESERLGKPKKRKAVESAVRSAKSDLRRGFAKIVPAITTPYDPDSADDAAADATRNYRQQFGGIAGGIYGNPYFGMGW